MKKNVLIVILLLTWSNLNYSQYLGGFGGGSAVATLSNAPLPVELNLFTAVINNSNVTLKWQTETEVNNYGFDVERTTSPLPSPYKGEGGEAGRGWQKIGFINGNGNSNSPKNYSFVDNNLIGGNKIFYRLKQIDNDGKFEYSEAIEVEVVPAKFSLFQNYPNPFNPSTKIRFHLQQECKVVIKIYNILGSELFEILNENKEAGIHEINFTADKLASGTYIYRIFAGSYVGTEKMILLK